MATRRWTHRPRWTLTEYLFGVFIVAMGAAAAYLAFYVLYCLLVMAGGR